MTHDPANDENFTGTRYFVDAVSERQYAIKFKDGVPTRPVHTYNGADLVPGETIIAFDDDMNINAGSNFTTVTTNAYQITSNASGDGGYEIGVATVTYKVARQQDGRLELELTTESKEALRQQNFNMFSFPARIKNVDTPSKEESGKFNISLPVHHANGIAAIARKANNAAVPTPVAVKKPRRARQAFNPAVQGRMTVSDYDLEQALMGFSKDLTEEARAGRLDPIVGRDTETDQAMKVLTRRKQSSLCFTGAAGVGKTAMFSAIAQRLVEEENSGKLPISLEGARVIELDIQAMLAGTKFRGEFEKRIKPIVDGLKERQGYFKGKKIILAIDEIHSQLSAGKSTEGGGDAGNMMKPFLTAKGVCVVGATTDKEYRQYIEKDGALASRFEKVRLPEPDDETTFTILRRLWPLTEEHNGLEEEISDDDLRFLIKMTNRYAAQEAQPRKGEKAMNTAAASAEFNGRDVIERKDIIAAVAQMSGLSVDFLSQNDADRYLKLEEELPQQVLGQPDLDRITDGLIGARGGLSNPNQPWGCFVLQGPTGTGKTETAKALARYLMGSEDAIVRIDMSEYSEKHTVSRLLGAPPGYVGFEDSEPVLEQVRQRGNTILLLDEIEKAHPDVFNILLPILEDGKTKDSRGNVIKFNNTIILMTTNAGAAQAMELLERGNDSGMGFGDIGDKASSDDDIKEKLKKIYHDAVTQPQPATAYQPAKPALFRPEMINRIEMLGGFITYVPLEPDVVSKIAVKQIKNINARLRDADGQNLPNVTLEVTPTVMEELCKKGYNRAMGARPMQKIIREQIVNPLTKWLMENRDNVEAAAKEKGGAKLVINSIEMNDKRRFAVPPTVKTGVTATNDNTPATKRAARKQANKKPAA